MLNKVHLIGNLGKDPVLRHTSTGKDVVELSVATSNSWKGKDGSTQNDTEWHRVVAWGNLANSCANNLSKGSKAYVEGRIQTRDWEDKEGNKRSSTEIIANRVLFLSGRAPKETSEGQGDLYSDDEIPF